MPPTNISTPKTSSVGKGTSSLGRGVANSSAKSGSTNNQRGSFENDFDDEEDFDDGEDSYSDQLRQAKQASVAEEARKAAQMTKETVQAVKQVGEMVKGGWQKAAAMEAKAAAAKALKKPLYVATEAMLRYGWGYCQSVFTIPLGLLFLDLAVFIGIIFGKKNTCPMGQERVPEQIRENSPHMAEAVGKKFALVENAGCCCLNGACALILISILGVTAVIAYPWVHPLDALGELATAILDFMNVTDINSY